LSDEKYIRHHYIISCVKKATPDWEKLHTKTGEIWWVLRADRRERKGIYRFAKYWTSDLGVSTIYILLLSLYNNITELKETNSEKLCKIITKALQMVTNEEVVTMI